MTFLEPGFTQRHLKPGLGHGDGGRGAGRPGSDDDGIELLLVSHSSQS
jgi:hypothetical protein